MIEVMFEVLRYFMNYFADISTTIAPIDQKSQFSILRIDISEREY